MNNVDFCHPLIKMELFAEFDALKMKICDLSQETSVTPTADAPTSTALSLVFFFIALSINMDYVFIDADDPSIL